MLDLGNQVLADVAESRSIDGSSTWQPRRSACRSLSAFPSSCCSASITPINRHRTIHPGNAGESMSTRTSQQYPRQAWTERSRNRKGNTAPAVSTPLSMKAAPRLIGKFVLAAFRLSMMTVRSRRHTRQADQGRRSVRRHLKHWSKAGPPGAGKNRAPHRLFLQASAFLYPLPQWRLSALLARQMPRGRCRRLPGHVDCWFLSHEKTIVIRCLLVRCWHRRGVADSFARRSPGIRRPGVFRRVRRSRR